MEYPQHRKAKQILKLILRQQGYLVREEVPLPPILTPKGERNYTMDLLAIKNGRLFCFEVDGFKGHSTRRDFQKMRLRDACLLQKGIKTIRIAVRDLVGRKKQELPTILEEIRWQLTPAKTQVSN